MLENAVAVGLAVECANLRVALNTEKVCDSGTATRLGGGRLGFGQRLQSSSVSISLWHVSAVSDLKPIDITTRVQVELLPFSCGMRQTTAAYSPCSFQRVLLSVGLGR